MKNSRIVYSTESGRHCPKCGRPQKQCACKKCDPGRKANEPADGVIRIRREVKGRKGKGVTTLSGFDMDPAELKQVAARLKRVCGTGGSVKDGIVIIQGDHRDKLLAELSKAGYKVKLAGG